MPTTYTVTGTVHAGSAGARGQLQFWPTSAAKHVDDNVYLVESEVEVDLDEDGKFSVDLYGTDDAGWSPADWQWNCLIKIINGTTEKITFDLTADSDLTDLV